MRMVEIATVELSKMNTSLFTLDEIMDDVMHVFNIDKRKLTGTNRKRELNIPRQIFMYIACRHSKYTLTEIGRAIGDRDHTTVMHARNAVSKHLWAKDEIFHVFWDAYIKNSGVWKRINK